MGRGRCLAVAGSVTLAATLAACSATPAAIPSASGGSGLPSIPLASSWAGPTTGWATVAMGHLDDPLNTFWQLFSLAPSASTWQLSTPAGVASNGGLIASVAGSGTSAGSSSGSVLVGFGPSLALHFSPLAASSDQGQTWTTGILPGALAAVPDALANGGAGGDLALLRGGPTVPASLGAGGGVVAGTGDLSTWKAQVSTRALATDGSASACRIQRLTAVTAGPAGSTVVGAACSRGGRPGIFLSVDGGWRSVGPSIPGVGGAPTEVVRLVATPAGTAALVSAGTGAGARLFAMWSTDGLGTWTVSAGLPLDGGTLTSTGVTASGGFVVDARSTTAGHPMAASVVAPPGGPWQHLAPPPDGATSVVPTPAGGFDAFASDQSTLHVYALGAGGWSRDQSLDVPIQYGSSG